MLNRERSVKVNLNHTNLFAASVKEINCFLNSIANRAHGYDNSFGILCTVVVKELVVCAKFFVNGVHIHFRGCNSIVIILVASLSVLEENIAVFGGAAKNRSFRIKSTGTEILNIVHINH